MESWMKDVTMETLPEAHRKIAEVIGVEATVKLCDTYGGLVLYVPKTDGLRQAARTRMIRQQYNGVNVQWLAKKFNLSTRAVQMIVSEVRPMADGQVSMEDVIGEM